MPQSKHQPSKPDPPPGCLRHGQRADAEIHSATTGYLGRSTRRGPEQGGGTGHGGRADHEDLIVAAPGRGSARPGIGRLSAVTVGIC
jgi:hypothetical protein